MKINKLILLFIVSCVLFSCDKDDGETTQPTNGDVVVYFTSNDYFSATVFNNKVIVTDDSTNIYSTNIWNGVFHEDYSIIQFGNHIDFGNLQSDAVNIYFAKSYHDTTLILNNSRNKERYSLQNPFRVSNDFHQTFDLNGEQPFFYSQNHGSTRYIDTTYSGLIVEYRFNGKWYDSFDNFSTDTKNSYEILKYEIKRENAVLNFGGTYYLPYGKVKIKFECYLKERNGTHIIHIENGEFQGLVNEL